MTDMSLPDVVVLGDANPDLVLQGDVVPRFGQAEQLLDGADLVVGGSGAIVACGLARLGISTALVGVLGADVFGDFMREQLTAAGVNTRWLRTQPDAPTGLTVVLSQEGDRAILTHLGAMATFDAASVDERLCAARHVHAASFFLQPGLAAALPGVFAAVRGHGGTTSLDTNWDPREEWAGVDDVLPFVDLLLPNSAELRALAGGTERSAAAQITAHGATVALKAGVEGGAVWTPEGGYWTSPGLDVRVVDTTGAGDSFDAGYISALIEGRPPKECLDRAVICGSLSTGLAGGTAAQPTRGDVDAVLASRP
jgi:sugar/nucleoside kinase (ribokinase family)